MKYLNLVCFLFILSLLGACIPEARKKCNDDQVLVNGLCEPKIPNPDPDQNLDCGVILNHQEESRIMYQSSSVGSTNSCLEEVQERSCENGQLSAWSGSFQFASCSNERVRYAASSVAAGSACQAEVQKQICQNGICGAWSPNNFGYTGCQVQGYLSCGNVPHNGTESRVAYSSSSVAYGQVCVQQNQTRTCNNGSWSNWSGTYQALSCSVQAAASCGSTPHNGIESRVAYSTSSVAYGQSCAQQNQTRTCNNGSWSSWSGSYQYLSCSVQGAASCGSVPHNGTESRVAYSAASVPYGQLCSAIGQNQTRTCDNGSWSNWSGSYQYLSCSVQSAASCGSVPHNGTESRIAYSAASVAYGQLCSAIGQNQTRTCNNGTWSSWSGTYQYLSCSVQGAASCGDVPNNGTESRVAYSAASVPYGQLCSAIGQNQTRTCNNGTWSSWSGTYQYLSCSVQGAASCGDVPNNGTESRVAYSAASVPYGQLCSAIGQNQTRTCNNGTWSSWSGTYQYLSCSVQGAASCGDVPNNGTESRVAYSAASVPYGQLCSAIGQNQTRTCNNGTWSSWSGTYQYLSCSVQAAASCGSIASGGYEIRTMYQAAAVSESQNCVSETQSRLCTNGQFGAWSGTYTQVKCVKSRLRYETGSVPAGSSCSSETQRMTCENAVCGVWVPNNYTFTACSVAQGDGCSQVSFAWNPNDESILRGYKIHQGTASMLFDKHYDVGLPNPINNEVSATVVDDFAFGETYYFTATAYGLDQLESGYSNQVSWTCLD